MSNFIVNYLDLANLHIWIMISRFFILCIFIFLQHCSLRLGTLARNQSHRLLACRYANQLVECLQASLKSRPIKLLNFVLPSNSHSRVFSSLLVFLFSGGSFQVKCQRRRRNGKKKWYTIGPPWIETPGFTSCN